MTAVTQAHKVPLLISDACTACGLCISTCPTHSLLRAVRTPFFVEKTCTWCYMCVEVCPRDAIAIYQGGR